MGQNHSGSVMAQCQFHHFAWMDFSMVNRARKERLAFQKTVLIIEI